MRAHTLSEVGVRDSSRSWALSDHRPNARSRLDGLAARCASGPGAARLRGRPPGSALPQGGRTL